MNIMSFNDMGAYTEIGIEKNLTNNVKLALTLVDIYSKIDWKWFSKINVEFNNIRKLLAMLWFEFINCKKKEYKKTDFISKKIYIDFESYEELFDSLSSILSLILRYSENYHSFSNEIKNNSKYEDYICNNKDKDKKQNSLIFFEKTIKYYINIFFSWELGSNYQDDEIVKSSIIEKEMFELFDKLFNGSPYNDFIRTTSKKDYILTDIQSSINSNNLALDIVKIFNTSDFVHVWSLAYRNDSSVYRNKNKLVNDLDIISLKKTKEDIKEIIWKKYPWAIISNEFNEWYDVLSYIVPPKGCKIKDVSYDLKKVKSYNIYDNSNEIVWVYNFDIIRDKNDRISVNSKEEISWKKALSVDFFINYKMPENRKIIKESFIDNSWIKQDIYLTDSNSSFISKLNFLRFKDIWDYNRYVNYSPDFNKKFSSKELIDYILEKTENILDNEFLDKIINEFSEELLWVNFILDNTKCLNK